ncbi:response regulator transcription factor [Rhizobium sp. FKY42]|uniref:LuxR C-terminal-related transcriptional regulator n=1 Tax=Rhizobium sp. FKY42 TaxID=2562310 RepID=UPI0010C0653B|nr:response regulator transcription factor [Rhizobium sp. FKY42]
MQSETFAYRAAAGYKQLAAIPRSQTTLAVTQEYPLQKLAIIDNRALERECLAQSLTAHGLNMHMDLYSSFGDWRTSCDQSHSGLLTYVGRGELSHESLMRDLQTLILDFPSLPVVILAETPDIRQALRAFEVGVQGYISSATGLSVCVGAISLALAGGAFISAEDLSELRQLLRVAESKERHWANLFTQREADVIDALTQGKPNKIIAYELDLRESTVKVHIRNIMKKLNARNRTEVIFRISDLLQQQDRTWESTN